MSACEISRIWLGHITGSLRTGIQRTIVLCLIKFQFTKYSKKENTLIIYSMSVILIIIIIFLFLKAKTSPILNFALILRRFSGNLNHIVRYKVFLSVLPAKSVCRFICFQVLVCGVFGANRVIINKKGARCFVQMIPGHNPTVEAIKRTFNRLVD